MTFFFKRRQSRNRLGGIRTIFYIDRILRGYVQVRKVLIGINFKLFKPNIKRKQINSIVCVTNDNFILNCNNFVKRRNKENRTQLVIFINN